MDGRTGRRRCRWFGATLGAAAGCSVWSPAFEDLTSERVAQTTALGLRVIPLDRYERSQMERLITIGVAGIITDYPNRLRDVLTAKKMPVHRNPIRYVFNMQVGVLKSSCWHQVHARSKSTGPGEIPNVEQAR